MGIAAIRCGAGAPACESVRSVCGVRSPVRAPNYAGFWDLTWSRVETGLAPSWDQPVQRGHSCPQPFGFLFYNLQSSVCNLQSSIATLRGLSFRAPELGARNLLLGSSPGGTPCLARPDEAGNSENWEPEAGGLELGAPGSRPGFGR
jgi:hypothetical protein